MGDWVFLLQRKLFDRILLNFLHALQIVLTYSSTIFQSMQIVRSFSLHGRQWCRDFCQHHQSRVRLRGRRFHPNQWRSQRFHHCTSSQPEGVGLKFTFSSYLIFLWLSHQYSLNISQSCRKRLTAEDCLKHPWITQREGTINKRVIPTDKLKKFIIRRKWQVRFQIMNYMHH